MHYNRECTGRDKPPEQPFRELWAIVGRRGGKSFIMSVIAVYLALFHDFSKYLAPGERGVVQIIAADRSQARVLFRYISAILNSTEVFSQYLTRETRERIELSTFVDLEVMTCSFRTIRGRTVVCAVCDEIAFWRVEGANPDREILAAIRPSMATIPNSMLLVISSPYARSGVLYEAHSDYFGKDDPEVLVWQAPTKVMNPTLDLALIEREMQRDPVAAAAEWGATFRSDVETYVPLEWIEQAIITNRYELPPARFAYKAFCDPSGGAQDSMTLAVGHREGGRLVQDVIRAVVLPFDPYQTVEDFARLLKEYRCTSVTGDKYAGAWVSEAFLKHGIRYVPSPLTKSEIYLSFEPLLARGEVELLDHKPLFAELRGLERRTGRGRRDTVDHGLGQHDDSANATAGVCVELSSRDNRLFPSFDPERHVRKEAMTSEGD
ncbi:MAG: hypothetical protein JSU72_13385 [Deltaproteobacteria bacterium]|nr:MAG: hypothetical protein JSU72_13385 [Deltaproteobacteria bacterium]